MTPHSGDVTQGLRDAFTSIRGTHRAVLLDAGLGVIREVSSRDITYSVKRSKTPVFAVIIDGDASKVIVKTCEERGVSYIGATTFSYAEGSIQFVSL